MNNNKTIESINLSSPFKLMLLGMFFYLTIINIHYIIEFVVFKFFMVFNLNPIFCIVFKNIIPLVFVIISFMSGVKLINSKIKSISINKITLTIVISFIASYIIIVLSQLIFILFPDTISSKDEFSYNNLIMDYPILESITTILSDILMYSSMILILWKYNYISTESHNKIE